MGAIWVKKLGENRDMAAREVMVEGEGVEEESFEKASMVAFGQRFEKNSKICIVRRYAEERVFDSKIILMSLLCCRDSGRFAMASTLEGDISSSAKCDILENQTSEELSIFSREK